MSGSSLLHAVKHNMTIIAINNIFVLISLLLFNWLIDIFELSILNSSPKIGEVARSDGGV